MPGYQQPLVSILIAFFNEEQFLAEAIESVLQQEYDHWELLLIDDGSTDNSTAIAHAFAKTYAGKINYYEHDGHINKGLSASRNKGLHYAKGGLIAFLDADDRWLPGKLANQVAIFRKHPDIGMVAEASLYWYSWHNPQRKDFTTPVGAPAGAIYPPGELLKHLYPLGRNSAPCPSALLISAQAVKRCGGFEECFTGAYQLYEDQAFLHKVYLKEKVYISAACNNLYRQRAGSIVRQVKQDGHYHIVRKFFLEWLQAYLAKEHMEDKAIYKQLDKAFMPYRHPQVYYLTTTFPAKVKHGMARRLKKLFK
jgi:glycosyltransferase involved in cell wall biosynthesis